jgi:spatacsin
MKMKSSFELLELAASLDCENKLLVMNDIMVAYQMTATETAEFIAKELAACIIRTRFLQFNKDTEIMIKSTSSWSPTREIMDEIWGFSLSKDLHLILELCPNTTLLGNFLLKYFEIFSKDTADIPFKSDDTEEDRICQHLNQMLTPQIISLKKQNTIRVEILITAHECFVHECSTEGIGKILALAKSMCNQLASKKSFTLIVKLLCGIGRYREMLYCFEILIKNEQFEALLGQFTDKQTNGLKLAILSYLNEYHPTNKEYYRMAASHFMMYTELANIWRKESLEKIQSLLSSHQVKLVRSGRINSNQTQQVEVPYLKKLDKDVVATLNEALNAMIHATEMVSMDKKIDVSIKFSSFCELIAVQIHLAKVGMESDEKMCPCVINQEQNAVKFQYLSNYELSVQQTLILMKNIDVKIDFSKAIFVHLLLEDETYLEDYTARLDLTDEMIEANGQNHRKAGDSSGQSHQSRQRQGAEVPAGFAAGSEESSEADAERSRLLLSNRLEVRIC